MPRGRHLRSTARRGSGAAGWPVVALVGLVGLVGCAGRTDDGGDDGPSACDDAPGWHDFAEGYVATWCTPCHASAITGAARNGAPNGVDFDRWSDVYAWRDRIAVRATGDGYDMPPLGGVDPADVDRLADGLACGAIGAADPPGPCDTLTPGPAATVGSDADAAAVCAAGNTVAGLTVTGTATIDCLCAVDGPLTVRGGTVTLPLAARVAGDLTLDGGGIAAASLAEVGGSVIGAGAVPTLELPALATVGGDVTLGIDGIPALRLPGLRDVAGALAITGGGSDTIDLPRLTTVGGGFTVEAMPALTALDGTRALASVGGDLILRDLPRLRVLDDWSFLLLAHVGGDVVIAGADALVGIHGFTVLPSIPGDLIVEDDAALVRIEGFDGLTTVGGDVRIRRNPLQQNVFGLVNLATVAGTVVIEDLPVTESLAGFEALAEVGGLRLVRVGAPGVPWFPVLGAIDGALAIEACPRIRAIDGFATLTAVGAVSVVGNPVLASIPGLGGVEQVGAVEVIDNPALPTAAVEAWVGGIDAVGGPVTIDGNG